MKNEKLPKRCELVNKRSVPKNKVKFVCKFATIMKRFLFFFLNVRGFRMAFLKLRAAWVGKDSGRAVKRGWVVGQKKLGALCAALFVFLPLLGFSDAVSDSLDRIDNNISNLSDKVDALVDAISGLNNNGGVAVAGMSDIDEWLDQMNTHLSTIQSLLGTSRQGLGRDVQTMRASVVTIQQTLLPQMLASSRGISNLLDQVVSKLGDNHNLDDIWLILNDIDGEIYYISDQISALTSFLYEWGEMNTNLLFAILQKIDVVVNSCSGMVSSLEGGLDGLAGNGGIGEGGGVYVNNLPELPEEYQIKRPFNWTFEGYAIKYLQSACGLLEWDDNLFETEEHSLEDSGDDFFAGVMKGFQNIMDINGQILENNHRMLLYIHQTADLDDIKRDLNDKLDEGANESEANGALIEQDVGYFQDAWNELSGNLKDKIDETFDTSGFEISSAPLPMLSFSGGSIMGFEYETFNLDFSDTLTDSFAEIIRSWMLFLYSATLIFFVLRIIPFGLIRFGGLMFMLFNINRNLQK